MLKCIGLQEIIIIKKYKFFYKYKCFYYFQFIYFLFLHLIFIQFSRSLSKVSKVSIVYFLTFPISDSVPCLFGYQFVAFCRER